MAKFDLVIFDMDGVLIDSHPIYKKADLEVLEKVGMDMKYYDQKLIYGKRVNEIAQYWVDNFPLSVTGPELVSKMNAKVRELLRQESTAMTGVYELLAHIESLSIPACIASTAPIGTIKVIIETLQIEHHFDALFSSEDCEFGKPHPQVFNNAIKHFGVEPNRALVIEDTPSGVEAAKAAGAFCVAVPEPELRTHVGFKIADHVVNDLTEVIDIISIAN